MPGGDPPPGVETPLEWEIRLWERAPRRRILIWVIAVAAGALGYGLYQNVVLATFGVMAILGSTTDFWLPLHYRIDAEGAQVRCGVSVTRMEWANVKRVIISEEGAKVSPLLREGKLSPFRGVYLRFAANRETVERAIRALWDGDVRVLEGGTDGSGVAKPDREGGR